MSVLAKAFIIINAILAMVFLGVTGAHYQHARDWRTEFMKLKERHTSSVSRAKKEIDALRTFVRAKNDVVSSKEREVRSLKTQLDAALSKASQEQKQFLEKKKEFDDLQGNFNQLSNRLDQALSNNEKLQGRKKELEQDLETANTRREVAEGQVARLTNLTTSLETDLADLRKNFTDTRKLLREKELLIAMAENSGFSFQNLPGPPVPAIDGRVVAVKSDLDPPLVLLSVGADDKVEQGFRFSIYRGGTFVGKVVVEKVLRDSAGCRVLFTADGQTVREGDSAATRLN